MISLLIVLVVAGVVMYLIENYIPMAEPFRVVIRIVVVLLLILYLLRTFGIVDIPLR
jgi:uncharacterized membrane protein